MNALNAFDPSGHEPVLIRAHTALTMRPDAPVLKDAAVIHDGRRILEVGAWAELSPGFSGEVEDMGSEILVPGLINAHVHLELSAMRGRIEPGLGFPAWVRAMVSDPNRAMDENAVRFSLDEAISTGTACMADISTFNARKLARIMDESLPGFIAFHECFGHTGPAPDESGAHPEFTAGAFDRGIMSLAGHALYSTSARTLKAAKEWTRSRRLPYSMHLAEHDDEIAITRGRPSEFLDMLKKGGVVREYEPPGMDPVPYADALGLLDEKTLCVHCVKVGKKDMEIVAGRGAFVCLCPRSNEFIGTGRAPWEDMVREGIRLCLGTDSLASSTDLDLWNEAVFLAEHRQGGIGLVDLVRFMTVHPAEVLGLDDRFGMIAPGLVPAFSLVPDKLKDLM